MFRQYNPQRFRVLPNGTRVGTISVGDVIYIQDGIRPFSFPDRVVCREPWRVLAWVPREVPCRNNAGRLVMKRSAGGHLAVVQSLRNSRHVQQVADWILLACVDAGLMKP